MGSGSRGLGSGLLWQGSPPHHETASLPRKGLSQSALPYRRSVPTVSSARGPGKGQEGVPFVAWRKRRGDGDHVCMRSAVLKVEGTAVFRFHPWSFVLKLLAFP